jgi:DUF971 family protein
MQPSHFEIIGTELAIRWPNGHESFFPLEKLRRSCPCAYCCGEPDTIGQIPVKPNLIYKAESFTISALQVVGGYALQPTWGDGHNTGLYSWQYLQSLEQIS